VDQSKLKRWILHLDETEDAEFSCADYFDLIAQYVDREIAGENVAETIPDLKRLLERCRDQCRACYEEYVVLLDLARLEAAGRAPSVEELRKKL
jgi:hypothetical protein